MSENGAWHLVSDQAGFLRLQQDWEALYKANPGHSPFLAWGWVNAWLTHLAGPHELRIVSLRDDGGKLVFLLPLLERKGSTVLVCSYGPECSEHLGYLCTPGLEPQSVALAADAIAQLPGGHTVSLACLDADADFPQQLGLTLEKGGRRTRLRPDIACPTLTLSESWEEFLQQLSSNFRSQVRRSFRGIGGDEQPAFRSLGPSEADRFASELIRLNQSRIAAKGEVSSLQDEAFRDFLHDAIPYMASQGIAWMDTIEQDGEVLGAALNFMHGDTVYYYMGGFDNKANKLRPGTALFALVMQRGIDAGVTKYDFLRGDESYKYRWGAEDVLTQRLTVYPRGRLQGLVSSAKDELMFTTRDLLRRARRLVTKGQ